MSNFGNFILTRKAKNRKTCYFKVSAAVNESSDEEDFVESDEEDEEGTTCHGDAEKVQS